jgi:hypothetical protein
MKYLLRILNHFKPKEILKPVGRWNNECNIKTNKKIDFSNEDHCGPCGENLLSKDKFKEIKHKD